MRALLQRARVASVSVIDPESVQARVVGELAAPGLVILVGVNTVDGQEQADALAAKVAHLRILEDETSLVSAGAPALVVSQFTLYGDARKGRRPSWSAAARPEAAEVLYKRFASRLEAEGVHVERGEFGAHMEVSLVNDGPFTLMVDTDDLAGPRV
ncbi:MAG: D-aminoacyl-tRNA deacylase [Micrococcus sp.]|nr:D-aminoacyl-tRNA deacylase [Micrococcus sp.]